MPFRALPLLTIALASAMATAGTSSWAQSCGTGNVPAPPALPPAKAPPALPMSVAPPSLPSSGGNASLASGLVAYWKLDDASGTTATDSVGSNTGTWNGTLGSQWTIGKINGGGNFNGTNNYISIPRTASLEPTSAITIEVWVKFANVPTYSHFVEKPFRPSGWSAPYHQYSLDAEFGKFVFNLTTAGTVTALTSNSSPSTGVWYHVVSVYDGATMSTYVNGALDNSTSKTGSIDYSGGTTNLDIGQRSEYSSGEFFPGIMDEVGIWNRALSAIEVATLYNAGTGDHYGGTCGFDH